MTPELQFSVVCRNRYFWFRAQCLAENAEAAQTAIQTWLLTEHYRAEQYEFEEALEIDASSSREDYVYKVVKVEIDDEERSPHMVTTPGEIAKAEWGRNS